MNIQVQEKAREWLLAKGGMVTIDSSGAGGG